MVSGDFSKYNQAVLSESQREQIDYANSSVNEQQQILNKQTQSLNQEEIKLNKSIKKAALSGSKYSIESILSAKKQLQQKRSQLSFSNQQIQNTKSQIQNTESQINAPLSQIKTPDQLESLEFKKEVSGNTTTYFKEDTYRPYKDQKKRRDSFREEEYIFVDGKPKKFIKRDDWSRESGNRTIDETEVIQFNNKGVVERVDLFDDGKRDKIEFYDNLGRIKEIEKYSKRGKEEERFFYKDDGSIEIQTRTKSKSSVRYAKQNEVFTQRENLKTGKKEFSVDGDWIDEKPKQNPKTKIKNRIITASEAGQSYETNFKNTLTGINTKEIIDISPTSKKITTIKSSPSNKNYPPVQPNFSTMSGEQIYISPKQYNSNKIIQTTSQPQDITSDSFITDGGNQIRDFGQKLQEFKVDDSPESFGYTAKKKVEKGVQIIGAGIETFGEFVNLADTPIKFSKGIINAAGQRGADEEYGFVDTILTFNDAYKSTSKNMQKNSPTISKVVDQDLDFIGNKLSQTGNKLKGADLIDDSFQQKGSDFKSSLIEKTELVSQTGVDLSYSGFEQSQKDGIINKVIGTVKQDTGIALTLLGESGSGILQPVKFAKLTEQILADVKSDNKAVKYFADIGEIAAGGSAYSGEIIADPKTYIAGEFEEAALLAKSPTKRGGQIIESIATNPKGFLKASLGETIFVTGGYAGLKAIATDIEIGAKITTNEIQNIAIENANKPKTPKDNFEETFYQNNPNSKIEYVSLDSVDVALSKPKSKPQGVQTVGEYAYKTNVVEFDLPTLPTLHMPEINIGRNTRLTKSEIGMALDYAAEIKTDNKNKSELGFENDNRAEIKFDEKFDQKSEIKFDDKYDFKQDIKTDTKTKTDFRTDSKFDYKYDYKYDHRIDEKIDQRTDTKIDWAMFGKGQSKKSKKSAVKALKDDDRYLSSLGGALLGKTSKNPTKDITGLKIRSVLLKNGRIFK